MIEKTFRGVSPHGTITAPLSPVDQWLDYTDEDLRLRTFQQSERTRDGKVAPFPHTPARADESGRVAVHPAGGQGLPTPGSSEGLENREEVIAKPLTYSFPTPANTKH